MEENRNENGVERLKKSNRYKKRKENLKKSIASEGSAGDVEFGGEHENGSRKNKGAKNGQNSARSKGPKNGSRNGSNSTGDSSSGNSNGASGAHFAGVYPKSNENGASGVKLNSDGRAKLGG